MAEMLVWASWGLTQLLHPSHHHFYLFSPTPLSPELLPCGCRRWAQPPGLCLPTSHGCLQTPALESCCGACPAPACRAGAAPAPTNPGNKCQEAFALLSCPSKVGACSRRQALQGWCIISCSSAGSWLQLGLPAVPSLNRADAPRLSRSHGLGLAKPCCRQWQLYLPIWR